MFINMQLKLKYRRKLPNTYVMPMGRAPEGLPTEVILLYGANDSIVPPIRSEYVGSLYNAKLVHTFAHEGGHFFSKR